MKDIYKLTWDDCRRGLRRGQNVGKGCWNWVLGWLFGWVRAMKRGRRDDFLRRGFEREKGCLVAERGV